MTILRESQGFSNDTAGFQPVAQVDPPPLKFDAYPTSTGIGHGSSFSPMDGDDDDDLPGSTAFSVESGASIMARDQNDRGGGKVALLIVAGLLVFVVVLLFISPEQNPFSSSGSSASGGCSKWPLAARRSASAALTTSCA